MESTNKGMPTHILWMNGQEEMSRWRALTKACQLTSYGRTARGGERIESINRGMSTHLLWRNRQEEVSRWRAPIEACQLTSYRGTGKRG